MVSNDKERKALVKSFLKYTVYIFSVLLVALVIDFYITRNILLGKWVLDGEVAEKFLSTSFDILLGKNDLKQVGDLKKKIFSLASTKSEKFSSLIENSIELNIDSHSYQFKTTSQNYFISLMFRASEATLTKSNSMISCIKGSYFAIYPFVYVECRNNPEFYLYFFIKKISQNTIELVPLPKIDWIRKQNASSQNGNNVYKEYYKNNIFIRIKK